MSSIRKEEYPDGADGKTRGISGLFAPAFPVRGLLSVALSVLLLYRIISLYSGVPSAPWGIDEDMWVQSSYFYYLFFKQLDFGNADWRTVMSYDQPPVARYIIGFALEAENHKLITKGGGLREWYRSVNDEYCRKRMQRVVDDGGGPRDRQMLAMCEEIVAQMTPTQSVKLTREDIIVARRTVFAFGVLSALTMAVLCARLCGPLSGLLAACLFLGNRLTVPLFQKAYVDSICAFFALATFLALGFLLGRLGKAADEAKATGTLRGGLERRVLPAAAVTGAALGLAEGTKIINIYLAVTIIAVFAAWIMMAWLGRRRLGRAAIPLVYVLTICLLLVLGFAFITFTALYPYMWESPLNALRIAEHHDLYREMMNRVQ
jgi:hypothetical protein